jgi:hypothetical protein
VSFSVKVIERDLGWSQILRTVRALRKGQNYVKVGLLGGAKKQRPGQAIDNVTLGLVHEFGSPLRGIPERSFIRAPFRNKRKKYLAVLRKLLQRTLTRKALEIRPALAVVGEMMAADFKAAGPGTPPPNAPETLRRKLAMTRPGSKGDPRSLVDTGRMLNSITYEVITGGGE